MYVLLCGNIRASLNVDDRMFNAEVSCENVHSQTRRMVMFSPEPNFWMHAVSGFFLCGISRYWVEQHCSYANHLFIK